MKFRVNSDEMNSDGQREEYAHDDILDERDDVSFCQLLSLTHLLERNAINYYQLLSLSHQSDEII